MKKKYYVVIRDSADRFIQRLYAVQGGSKTTGVQVTTALAAELNVLFSSLQLSLVARSEESEG